MSTDLPPGRTAEEDGDTPDDDLSDSLVLSDDQARQVDEFQQRIRLCVNDSEKYELCARRRDGLLASHAEVQLLIAASERVMRGCAEYRALKHNVQATMLMDDSLEPWKQFIRLATKKSTIECIRCLKRVGWLWGQDVIQHYGWVSKEQKFCKALRAGALENRDWDEAVVKLNRLMLYRHRTLGKRQIRHSANPIDQVDLQNLAAWKDQGPLKMNDSRVAVPFESLSVRNLPPGFGFDKFGLLIRVEFAASAQPHTEANHFSVAELPAGPGPILPPPPSPDITHQMASGNTAAAQLSSMDLASTHRGSRAAGVGPTCRTSGLPLPATSDGAASDPGRSELVVPPFTVGPELESWDPKEISTGRDSQQPTSGLPSSSAATLGLLSVESDAELPDGPLPAAEMEFQHPESETTNASSDTRSKAPSLRPRPHELHYHGMAGVARQKANRHPVKELASRLPSSTPKSANWSRPPGRQCCPAGFREAILDEPFQAEHLCASHRQRLEIAAASAAATQFDRGFGTLLPKRRHSLSSLDFCKPSLKKQLREPDGGVTRHFAQYLERSACALHCARSDAAEFLTSVIPGSRLCTELPYYIEILGKSAVGRPITAQQYRASNWNQPADTYVLCTPEEARLILEAGTPRLPILVPGELNPERRLDLDQYLAFLSTRTSIDVHAFDVPMPKGKHVLPLQMPTGEAIRRFRDSQHPLNFLNLAGYKANPIPQCFEGLPAYSILRDVQSNLRSGKKSERLLSDLSECCSFQICSKRGSFSLPHVDQHGVITAVFCDQGEKIWNMWIGLGIDALREYAESESLPASPCTSLILYPGCLLIMPSGTLHAVWSPTDVLLSGTMYWDSRDMLRVAQLTECTAKVSHLSNEDIAEEFGGKIKKIAELWEENSPAWPWGPANCLSQFKDLVEVRQNHETRERETICH